jgi:FAD/FMN-containing dehydrogenase
MQGAPGYEEARRDFNARFSKFPKAIVYCRNAQDAANAIIWVRKTKTPFRVRSGGHSYEAYSLADGGLVIDVSELLQLRVDRASGTASVGAGWQMLPLYEAFPSADDRLTSTLELPVRHNGDIRYVGLFAGLEKELRRTVRPLLDAVPPKSVSIRSTTWIEAARRAAGPPVRHAKFKHTSAYAYQPLPDAALSLMIRQLKNSPGTGNLVTFDAYGGTIGRVAPHETAFVHRQALFVMQYQSYWKRDTEEAANIAWIERFRTSMPPYTRGAYRNYCDSRIGDWQTAYFGENATKLKHVKRRYDPDDLFQFEQSIPL